jgi:hypothetical protein
VITFKPTLHSDGTVTYFSRAYGRWHKRSAHIPAEELAHLDLWERRQVQEHLARAADPEPYEVVIELEPDDVTVPSRAWCSGG